jgi:hypothetical protein
MKEVEEQSRFLEADQAASGVVSSQMHSRLLGQRSGNTYSAVFSGSNNSGMQVGYGAGTINWNAHSKNN